MAKKSPVQGKKRGSRVGGVGTKTPVFSMKNRQAPPSAPSRSVSIGPSDPKASKLQTKLVKSKFSMNSRKKALAENLIASKKARQAAGTGFKAFNVKAEGIQDKVKTKEFEDKHNAVWKQSAAKKKAKAKKAAASATPKAKAAAAPKKTKTKSTGSGKRTRSFSEGKIKRDKNGRFARK